MKKLLLFGALIFWFSNLFAQSNFIRQDSAFARVQNCTNGVSICIDSFTFDSINSLRFYLDGRQFSSDFTPCFIDTIHNYGYSDIFRGSERGPWRLDSWSVSGQTFTGQFASLAALTDSMRRWDPSGDWTLEEAARIIYGRAMGGRTYTCQQITGLTRNGRTEVCYNTGLEYRGLRFTVPRGVHQLIVEKVASGQRDTIWLVAACIAPDVVRQTIQVGSSQTYCMDTTQLVGRVGALVNYCGGATSFARFDAPNLWCVRFEGLAVGVDTACLRICDQYGICDTTTLIVTVSQTPTRLITIRDTITVGLSRTNRGISLPTGTITNFDNYCANSSGTNVRFTLNADRTVSYTGLTEGVDTVCIRACAGAVCDTTILIVEVKPEVNQPRLTRHIFRDTITIGLAARSKCSFDAPANATIIENICSASSGSNINFTVNTTTKCVTYRGLTIGTDTACIRICNGSDCDTTYMYIEALNPQQVVVPGRRIVIEDTITSGLSRTRCGTNGLSIPPGTLTEFHFEPELPEPIQTSFSFYATLDTITKCVTYQGLNRGVDSLAIVACNTEGVCDTTIIRIRTIGGNQDSVAIINIYTNVNTSGEECQLNLPPGRPVSIRNTCPSSAGRRVSLTLDTVNFCVKYRALSMGAVDTACIEICDSANRCHKSTVLFYVLREPRQIIIRDTITVGQFKVNCDSIPNLPADSLIFIKVPLQPRNFNVAFRPDSSRMRNCISYRGLRLGTDSVRYSLIVSSVDTTFGVYDSYLYIVTVIEGNRRIHEFRDTITVGLNRVKCNLAAPANPTRIRNICEPQSGSNVDFMINASTYCVDYMGVTNGVDTACIEICNAAGVCDTTYMYITANPPRILRGGIKWDSIIVRVNETKQYCADSSRVGNNFLRQFYQTNPLYSVANPIDANGRPTACLSIRGSLVGRDTVNMILSGNGIQDTTRLIIIVRPAAVLPTTSSDTVRLKIFESTTYCPDSSELAGSNIRFIGFCSTDPFDNANVSLDTVRKCVNVRGLTAGQDTFCIILCNFAGFCDTTKLFVNVSRDTVQPTLKLDSVRLFVGDSTIYCGIDTLEIRGRVDSIRNYCLAASGTNSSVQLTASNCLKIKGLRAGVDTACMVVCNRASGICDTTRVLIRIQNRSVDPPRKSTDTVRLAIGELKVYCPDTSELRGAVVSSLDFCTADNFDNAQIRLNSVTKCVEVRGLAAGRDTTCLLICNAANVCDTTILHVIVSNDTVRPVLRTDTIQIGLNQDTLYCNVDTTQIRGAVDSIYDACPGRNGTKARMILNPDTRCVNIRGVGVGSDTMCLVVYNRTTGLRDTTIVVVIVRNTQVIRLLANDDFDSLRRGGSKEFMLYANDTISRTPTSMTIISPPRRGKVDTISFQRGIVVYRAGTTFAACGLDTFSYRVCIDTTCDIADVIVNVVCSDSLKVFNAISPNGDGKNDVLTIEGLHNFPNHTVCVFNRWGNEVFKTKAYQNDWGGLWNGKELPDGTYFYWIRDDEKGEILKTGYLQLMR
jgi:gliding motility-associated-like protein